MDAQAQVTAPVGLTTAEAAARRRAGAVNTPVSSTSRSYATILRTNVFSFYNSILFIIGAALLAMGRYNDAFVSVGLGLVNAVISAVQEIGAKRKLDGLQRRWRRPRSCAATSCACGRVTRSSWTDRCSRAAGSRPTSPCSRGSQSRW
jgi:magnesium-transporting ATPase (P-type)